MQLKFQVHTKIQKPLAEVFDAVYNPTKLSGYFTTGGASAPLDEDATVTWRFADYPGDVPVIVKKLVPNQQIVLQWDAYEPPDPAESKTPPPSGYKTTVEMTFESLDPNNTLVKISESGWRETQKGLDGSYGNCFGWSQMISALKAYLEYGINLRKGAY
ncbi:MAG TPA: SRPBCC family protein [Edaphobacter sp.]|nr:SRPBCC family protein [Edaphobacter sp.]